MIFASNQWRSILFNNYYDFHPATIWLSFIFLEMFLLSLHAGLSTVIIMMVSIFVPKIWRDSFSKTIPPKTNEYFSKNFWLKKTFWSKRFINFFSFRFTNPSTGWFQTTLWLAMFTTLLRKIVSQLLQSFSTGR